MLYRFGCPSFFFVCFGRCLFWRFGDDNIHTTSTTIIWKSAPPSDFARPAITTSFWTRSFSLSFLFSQLCRCLCPPLPPPSLSLPLSLGLSARLLSHALIPFHVSFVHSRMIRMWICVPVRINMCARHVRCGAALDYAHYLTAFKWIPKAAANYYGVNMRLHYYNTGIFI